MATLLAPYYAKRKCGCQHSFEDTITKSAANANTVVIVRWLA